MCVGGLERGIALSVDINTGVIAAQPTKYQELTTFKKGDRQTDWKQQQLLIVVHCGRRWTNRESTRRGKAIKKIKKKKMKSIENRLAVRITTTANTEVFEMDAF